jgi:hypothetical protein
MGRFGFFTRIAMIVFGAIWLAAGGSSFLMLVSARFASGGAVDGMMAAIDYGPLGFPGWLIVAGLMMLKTGLTPDPPKTFENEIPDACPDLSDD